MNNNQLALDLQVTQFDGPPKSHFEFDGKEYKYKTIRVYTKTLVEMEQFVKQLTADLNQLFEAKPLHYALFWRKRPDLTKESDPTRDANFFQFYCRMRLMPDWPAEFERKYVIVEGDVTPVWTPPVVNKHEGWIAVDLDRTLAHYDEWISVDHIGEPIWLMAERVRCWLAEGVDVRIFTARVTEGRDDIERARKAIQDWTFKHFGKRLPVTNRKDYAMTQLWDDLAMQVLPNSGIALNDVFIAATALFLKLEEIHHNEEYKSVWVLHENRGGSYKGPTYSAEFEALREALGAK